MIEITISVKEAGRITYSKKCSQANFIEAFPELKELVIHGSFKSADVHYESDIGSKWTTTIKKTRKKQ